MDSADSFMNWGFNPKGRSDSEDVIFNYVDFVNDTPFSFGETWTEGFEEDGSLNNWKYFGERSCTSPTNLYQRNTDEHTGDGSTTSPTKPPSAYWDTLASGDTTIVMNTPGDIMIRTSTNQKLNVGAKGWKLRADEGQNYPIIQIDHSGSDLIKNDKKIVLKEDPQIIQRRAMAELCSLLLNLNEFVYVD